MAEQMKVIREIEIPYFGQTVEVTHLGSKASEFVHGVVERVLDINYYGPDDPPEIITFNGRRFTPEAKP